MYQSLKCSALILAIGLTMPATGFADDAALTSALAGKTISSGKAVLKVRKNGRLSGKVGPNGDVKFEGAWTIRDGKWCRTIKEPASFAGTECQAMTLGDGVITITGRNGPVDWQIN